MWLIIVLLILFLIFVALLTYFFIIAFVRAERPDIDDLDAKSNEYLADYIDELKVGMNFINHQHHRWVFTTSYDGLKLAARYYNNNSEKTILLLHGYRSSSAHDFCAAVKFYYELGFNILLVDQRSHGKSQGKLITFGVKESRDVNTWVNFINARYAPKKIILSGISMGATTAVLSLKHSMPSNVVGIVSDCGFTSPADIIRKVGKQVYKIDAKLFLPILNLACLAFGKFSILKDCTIDAARNTQIPILFIHGESDNFVPCEMTRETYEAAGENATLLTVKDADHGVSFLVDKKTVLNSLTDFFEKVL